jgi:hypothetical protein
MRYIAIESYSKYDNINNSWTTTPGKGKMATLLAAEAWELDAEDSFEQFTCVSSSALYKNKRVTQKSFYKECNPHQNILWRGLLVQKESF